MKPFLYSSQRISVGKHILFLFFMSLVLPGFSPETCLADAKRIIEENKGGVVILFSYDKEGNQTGHATGFIVSNDGVVLTNYHFISKAARIEIKTEEKILEARGLLYIDKGNDIAALKIEGKDFPALKIRDNGAGPEGQKIYLIGSPRGEEKILLEGMLSRIKDITPERKLLLLTVPVTEGSSGSPIFNENGEVIGIATFFMDFPQPFYFAMTVSPVNSWTSLKKITPLDKEHLVASENTAEYWINLGAAYDSLGMYSDASRAYQRVIEISPEDAIAHNKLGIVYAKLDIYSFAIREHNEAISLKPDYQEAYYNLGIDYIKSDKIQEAAKAFEEAIRLKPDDAKSHNNLAVTFFKSGKLKEAADTINHLLLIKPDYAEAYYNLGAVYSQMNMYAEAAEALKQFISLKPDIAEAHLRLGIIYSMQDAASALKEYEILKSLDPDSAEVLHKIIQAKKNISSDSDVSSANAAKEEIPQEAADGSSKPTLSPAVSSPPQKKDRPSVASEASPKDSSYGIGGPEEASTPEATKEMGRLPKKDIYSVQLSIFNNKENALSLSERLKKKGYDVFIKTELRDNQKLRYRVLVGRFSDKTEALKTADVLLKKEDLKSIIFKH